MCGPRSKPGRFTPLNVAIELLDLPFWILTRPVCTVDAPDPPAAARLLGGTYEGEIAQRKRLPGQFGHTRFHAFNIGAATALNVACALRPDLAASQEPRDVRQLDGITLDVAEALAAKNDGVPYHFFLEEVAVCSESRFKISGATTRNPAST
jgi:hypothetical protein